MSLRTHPAGAAVTVPMPAALAFRSAPMASAARRQRVRRNPFPVFPVIPGALCVEGPGKRPMPPQSTPGRTIMVTRIRLLNDT